MEVINIALRRKDGKVECDTLYAEKMLSEEQVKEISEKHECDVMVVNVGTFTPYEDGDQTSIVYNRPTPPTEAVESPAEPPDAPQTNEEVSNAIQV